MKSPVEPEVAATVYVPAVAFAVNAADVAMPLEFVVALVVFVPESANVPLAKVDGAVNVTTAPETGLF